MKALKSFGQTPESWIPARRAHSLSNDEYRVRVHRVHRIPCSISCSGTSMFVQPQMGSMKSSSTHLRRVMVSATDSTAGRCHYDGQLHAFFSAKESKCYNVGQ